MNLLSEIFLAIAAALSLAGTSVAQPQLLDGLVVANIPSTWFSLKVSHPIVLKFGEFDYRMWAYGRELTFDTYYDSTYGRIGYFFSFDGIHWIPIFGDQVLGSVMSPSRGTDLFDGGEIGCTDVFFLNDIFYMSYQGSRDFKVVNDTFPFEYRSGVALSADGVNWQKCQGPDPSLFGAYFGGTPGIDLYPILPTIYINGTVENSDHPPPPIPIGHPHPLPDCTTVENEGLPHHGTLEFKMLYASFASSTTLAGQYGATSDDFFFWNKTGYATVPQVGPRGSWDSILTGDVRYLEISEGNWIGWYEGEGIVNGNLSSSIGLLRSTDGVNWEKDTTCTGTPGGPVLTPRQGQNAWDNFLLGTPFPVIEEDLVNVKLYYVGIYDVPVIPGLPPADQSAFNSQIGLAKSVKNAHGVLDYCNYERVNAIG